MKEQDLLLWLWLANAMGPAASNALLVLEKYKTIVEIQKAVNAPDAPFAPQQLAQLKQTNPQQFKTILQTCETLGVQIVTWGHDIYPQMLRDIASPPLVLYYKGELSVLDAPLLIGMIGTRKPSAYGIEATVTISKTLAEAGVVLVSGLAQGLDSEAHKASLKAETATVACLAFGHDRCYPANHKQMKDLIEKQGLTIGEYPPGTETQKQFFIQRNRLIAGFAQGVCVTEARSRSGTAHTVSAALENGRDVFSVPGSIFSPLSEGSNRMIREGAIPATCGEDILQHYGIELTKQKQALPKAVPQNSLEYKLQKLLSQTPISLFDLCEQTGLSPGKLMATLTQMELAGLVRQHSGRCFSLKI